MARRREASEISGKCDRQFPKRLVAGILLGLVLASPVSAQVDEGAELFETNCASCHGSTGEGTEFGPAVTNAGAAGADFQLRTGRMPLPEPGAPTLRKPPAFNDDEISDLVAYVDTLGEGPDIPIVDLSNAELSEGAELFASNCAACHGATANGGAVGGSAFAPSLDASSSLDVAEATLVGPGEMPSFAFTDEERNSIVSYVRFLRDARDPGGLDIGGVGPVPEGFIAWAFGMVVLVGIAMLIGRERGEGPGDEA